MANVAENMAHDPMLPFGYLEPRWYAAHTIANHEKRVAVQLTERSVEHFLPMYQSVRRWKDRRVELQLPLYPGLIASTACAARRHGRLTGLRSLQARRIRRHSRSLARRRNRGIETEPGLRDSCRAASVLDARAASSDEERAAGGIAGDSGEEEEQVSICGVGGITPTGYSCGN